MKTTEAIAHMIKVAGMPKAELSRRMGKARTFVSSTITKGSTPRADTLAAMARHLGYTLLLRGHGEEIELEGVDDADGDQGPADQY